MQNQDTKNILVSNANAPHAEHDEELLRFARRLDMHRDLEGLLQALPTDEQYHRLQHDSTLLSI